VFVLLLFPPTASRSQDVWKGAPDKEITGFRAIFLRDFDDSRKKVIDLAEAMPEGKYSWRPMEGVRSVSEVFVHIATDNYYMPGLIGQKTTEKFSQEDEKKITEKAKVLAHLKKSFDFIKEAALKISEEDLNKPADFFGTKTTCRGILFHAANHWHEHLGQAIAYARMNKIVPPWTAAQQAEEEKSDSKK
jgi:uncharacterized damage-inducible protein DinB